MKRKLETAIRHPSLIVPYLREGLWDDLEVTWLHWRADGDLHTVDLGEYRLAVDLTDRGIGRDLVLDGEREPHSSAAYREELIGLRESMTGTVRVAEIGANIGYYALIPPTSIDDVQVYAAEVSPENVALLRDNVERNGVDASVAVDCIAIGDANGEMEVHLSTRSNRNSLQGRPESDMKYAGTTTVPVKRGETWLGENGLATTDLHVLRMDVEGYEAKVLRGLPDLDLDLVHIEVHPYLMSESETDDVIDRLDALGLEVVAAAKNDRPVPITELDEIREYRWVEVVASR